MSICIDNLDRLVNQAYEKGYFSGSILVAENQRPIFTRALGISNMDNMSAVKEDSIFYLASISKQFTASAIMLLCQRKKLRLDDPMEKYIPNTNFHGRCIRNLLNHTCGLPDYMEWVDNLAQKEGYVPDNSVIERFLSEAPVKELFVPGERFAYSNTGYSALAYIIQKVSGMSYGDFLRKEIFIPAGMKDTQVCHIYQTGTVLDKYAYGYVLENGKYVSPKLSKANSFAITLDGIEGDGSVCSTVNDLLLWDTALKEGKILSKDIQNQMYTPASYGNGESQGYGYGWNVAHDPDMGFTVFHSGSWPGYNTYFTRYLDKNVTLIVLMNQSGCDCRGRKTFIDGLGDIVRGKEPREIISTNQAIDKSINIDEFKKYCGDYEGGIKLWIENKEMYISFIFRAEMKMKTRLYPAGGNKFVTYLAPQDITIDDLGITGPFERKVKTYRKL